MTADPKFATEQFLNIEGIGAETDSKRLTIQLLDILPTKRSAFVREKISRTVWDSDDGKQTDGHFEFAAASPTRLVRLAIQTLIKWRLASSDLG